MKIVIKYMYVNVEVYKFVFWGYLKLDCYGGKDMLVKF